MLNFINNRFRNNKFRKIKDLNLKKIGLVSFVWIFCATLFLSGSNFARGGTSATALPISFGGTGATTQAGALTNLGINSTIDKNSSNGTFPSAKTVYNYMNRAMNKGYISMDNINFSSSITSWTGGDLIYKGSNLSSTATNNKIKVGDKACTTSGQGYTSNSAADDGIPQVGCVLPNLAAGTHAVTISTDGGSTYTINAGNVVYAENVKLSNCDTASMQTFGTDAAACKAAMQQGQAIVLNDTRNNQKYRVKKMPDGNVWMIDNLKLGSTTSTTTLTPTDTNIASNYTLPQISNSTANSDPGETTYCSSSGLVHTHNPGNTTGCGYLYTWKIAMAETSSNSGYSISPKGWGLHPNSGTKSANELSDKMLAVAANSNSNRNPVYSTTGYKNFGEGDTNYPAPWLGVYSGYYRNNFANQGSHGYYCSSTELVKSDAYSLYFYSNDLNTKNYFGKSDGHAVRSVL